MRPTWLAVALGGVGLIVAAMPALGAGAGGLGWVAYWAALLLLLAVDGALIPRKRRVHIDVKMPAGLGVGDSSHAHLNIIIDGAARRSSAQVAFEPSEELAALPPQSAQVGPGAAPIPVALTAMRRGRGRIKAVWLALRGPLGLMVRSERRAVGAATDISPNLAWVRAQAIKYFSSNALTQGLNVERNLGGGSEFDALIEFQPGMDHRTMDWRSSARHRKLLSRRFRPERDRQVIVAMDTGRLMAAPIGALTRLDHAIHAGLLLATFAARTGDRVGLYSFAAQPGGFIEPRSGARATERFAHMAAGLSYSNEETNFTLGLTHLLSRLRRRSLVIVLTEFVDSITAELMRENLGRLARRHLVIFVSLRDPTLGDIATQAPDTLDDLHRSVVADRLDQDRALVFENLKHHGIFCIDAGPSEASVALVNRYLQVKRRELL